MSTFSMLRFTAQFQSFDQGSIGRFAGQPRYSGSVISLRQVSIRIDSPLEQVGEHHCGAGGCLASCDSGGIRAGATDGGSELGGVTAQPPASNISAGSTSISNRSLFLRMRPHLFLDRLAAILFFPGATLAQHLRQAIAAVALSSSLPSLSPLDIPTVLVGAPVGRHHQQ